MLFAVLFEDDPERAPAARADHLEDHLTFLEGQAERIRAAGPLRDRSDAITGGLWLVDAQAVDEVEELVRADPFWPTGLRRSTRILTWTKVFAAGRRII